MKNTKTHDDYLDDLLEDIGEPPSKLESPKTSSITNQSPKDDLDHVNADASVKLHQNSLISSNKEEDMETIDGKYVLSPLTPRKTAEIFIQDKYMKLGVRTLQCSPLKGEFYRWVDSHYQFVSDFQLKSEIGRFLDFHLQKKKDETGKEVFVSFTTSSAKETEVLSSVKNFCLEGILQDPGMGASWIFGVAEHPEASMIIPFKNHLLSIGDFLKDEKSDPHKCLFPLSPQFFDTTQIPFNIEPSDHGRLRPVKFIKFLEDIFDEDFDDKNNRQSISFLQQWFGYCLTNMTWAQKILLIVGPPRSGKGTIANVLQAMLGDANFTNPSAASMSDRFPLEAWINKRLAIMGDARFVGDKKEIVKEILLQVSGGDRVNVDRKHKSMLPGVVLSTKIMILSNSLPKFRDEGAAFASRFIILKLKKSFLGKEDPELFDRDLKPEIPLIFWWALDGLRELMKNKRFTQPERAKDCVDQMKAYESPVKGFTDEKCIIGDAENISKKTLFNLYELWCKENEVRTLDYNIFCEHVLSACPSVVARKLGSRGERVPSFSGICSKDRAL